MGKDKVGKAVFFDALPGETPCNDGGCGINQSSHVPNQRRIMFTRWQATLNGAKCSTVILYFARREPR